MKKYIWKLKNIAYICCVKIHENIRRVSVNAQLTWAFFMSIHNGGCLPKLFYSSDKIVCFDEQEMAAAFYLPITVKTHVS